MCLQNLANKSLVDETLNKVEGLKSIASELNVPLAQMAIAWVAKNPNVSSVITGATKEHQVCLCSALRSHSFLQISRSVLIFIWVDVPGD